MNILDRGAERLRAAGIESPRREARLLLAHAMGVGPDAILAGNATPDAAQREIFEALVARRIAHEPMAYILGAREFWSLDFAVGPGVLIPRPDTEVLVEQALKAFPDKSAALDVLDLGTGSGCLLLAFLSERPNARGLGVDASVDALTWAKQNAATLGLANRMQFHACDWSAVPDGTFDVIFSNPPYITTDDIATLAPDVRAYEPHTALDGGSDGLAAYRCLAAILPERLRPAGRAFVEIGQGQNDLVSEIFSNAGLAICGVVPDLAGIPRCLIAMPALQQVKQKKDVEMHVRNG